MFETRIGGATHLHPEAVIARGGHGGDQSETSRRITEPGNPARSLCCNYLRAQLQHSS